MKKNAYGHTVTTVVDGSSFTGLLAADGSLNIVIVDGSSFVGVYHACGAANAVVVDGSSFVGAYNACGAINVIVDTSSPGGYHASGSLRVTTAGGAFLLLAGETEGLAFDFTDQSAYILDTGTPANNVSSVGNISEGALIGPGGSLTYTNPSNKLCLQEDGYYSYGAHNLLDNSEVFDAYSATGCTVSSNVMTATSGGTNHRITKNLSTTAGHPIASVWYVIKGTNDYIQVYDGAHGQSFAYFDLAAVATGTVGTNTTASIEDLGGGVLKCTAIFGTGGANVNGNSFFALSDTATGAWARTFSALGTETVTIVKAHYYYYPAVTDYVKTTTTKVLTLPYTYDTNGVREGMLVEEARTNLFIGSRSLQGFSINNATFTASYSGNGLSIFGDYPGRLADTSGGGTGGVYATVAVTFSAATTYTISAYAKQDQLSWLYINIANLTDVTAANAYFDLANGVTGTVGADATASIEDVGNGWYRCSIVFTTVSDTSGSTQFYVSDGDGNITIDLDGTSSILFDQIQLEAGSFVTSPILTYGVTATRAIDNIRIAVADFPSAALHSCYMQVDYPKAPTNPSFMSWYESSVRYSRLWNSTSNGRLYAGGTENVGTATTLSASDFADYSGETTVKIAGRFDTDDGNIAINGGAGVADTDWDQTDITATHLYIGSLGAAAGSTPCAPIRKLLFVPRIKTDAELEADTA